MSRWCCSAARPGSESPKAAVAGGLIIDGWQMLGMQSRQALNGYKSAYLVKLNQFDVLKLEFGTSGLLSCHRLGGLNNRH